MSLGGLGIVNLQGGYAIEDGVPLPVISQAIKAKYEIFLGRLMVNQSMVLPEEARYGIRDSEDYITEVLPGGAVRVWRIK